MSHGRRTSQLTPVPSDCRFVFIGTKRFVVTKVLVQATSALFSDKEIEHLPDDEEPDHFRAYLHWAEGKGVQYQEDDGHGLNREIWLELGDLWFFGGRIGALQFQDAVMLECLTKRDEKTHPINQLTVDYFFSPPYEVKTPFHTFLVDMYFMTTETRLSYYDNDLFQMACSARQVYLSEAIAKMMIKKRKREHQKQEAKRRGTWKIPDEPEEPITLNVLLDYIVTSNAPYDDDKKHPASRRDEVSSDEDERGSTRMRGSAKLDLIKRVLETGKVE
jgi:hypothetical protein